MENKINVAKLLKGCPEGMELDSTMLDNVTFESVDVSPSKYPIAIKNLKTNEAIYLTKYGQFVDKEGYKCIIYPKGKTSWEGFVPPCKFKNGDILTNERGSICIYKGTMYYNQNLADFYCGYRVSDHAFIFKKFKDEHFGDVNKMRIASEIEKQHFFQILLDNGYQWNSETKTLEKLLKFKVGDRIIPKDSKDKSRVINAILDNGYNLFGGGKIAFSDQDNWELIPDKFNISTLVPFESKVLVRDSVYDEWKASFWGHLTNNCHDFKYDTTRGNYIQCIPYEGNEHLLGKIADCDEYFKTWK